MQERPARLPRVDECNGDLSLTDIGSMIVSDNRINWQRLGAILAAQTVGNSFPHSFLVYKRGDTIGDAEIKRRDYLQLLEDSVGIRAAKLIESRPSPLNCEIVRESVPRIVVCQHRDIRVGK